MVALIALAVTGLSLPQAPNVSLASTSPSGNQNSVSVKHSLKTARDSGLYTIYKSAGGAGCREASIEEASRILQRNPNVKMHNIGRAQTFSLNAEETPGLQIILRGTDQLEQFPLAKQAFLNAAQTWQDKIQTAITIIIDVDFGPTRFGQTYPNGVLGSTDSQLVGDTDLYSDVRASLIANASSPQEAAFYNTLPQNTIPTDLGDTAVMIAPTAVFRALDFLPPVADPDAEGLGDPPSIGFNSNFDFDFDPSDGISPNTIDFDAVATHEIGHALGFSSVAALVTKFPKPKKGLFGPTTWDLFRLRPRTPSASYSTADRVLSAGGEQVFSAGGVEANCATGTGSNGDGDQASHWKADELTGRYVGIMDPTIADGEREVITSHDLLAVESFGYTLRPGINLAAEAGNFAGILEGDKLTLTGSIADTDGNAALAQVRLLNSARQPVAPAATFPITSNGLLITGFNLTLFGLSQLPDAIQAEITLTDSLGNVGRPVRASIFLGDIGGPAINNVTYNGKKMVIKGNGYTGAVQLEINGVLIGAPVNVKVKGGGTKIKIKADSASLHLVTGLNRVRVISNNLKSDIFILSQ